MLQPWLRTSDLCGDEDCMKANTRFGAGHKCQHRREACQEFHINDRIDANSPDPKHRSQRASRQPEKTPCRDRYHISLRNNFHRVENESIVFEYDEVNVLTADHLGRTTNRGIGENG